jgi:predicted nucleic acid-binding OB-fold protein
MSDPADDLPVLTQAVSGPKRLPPASGRLLSEADVERLRERLLVGSFELLERLVSESLQEMELRLYEDLTARLREELPELVERVLDQQLRAARGRQGDR